MHSHFCRTPRRSVQGLDMTVQGMVYRCSHQLDEIGNLLPNNQRQRRTCYALCHILYHVSALARYSTTPTQRHLPVPCQKTSTRQTPASCHAAHGHQGHLPTCPPTYLPSYLPPSLAPSLPHSLALPNRVQYSGTTPARQLGNGSASG